jgi:hypothetical protein
MKSVTQRRKLLVIKHLIHAFTQSLLISYSDEIYKQLGWKWGNLEPKFVLRRTGGEGLALGYGVERGGN